MNLDNTYMKWSQDRDSREMYFINHLILLCFSPSLFYSDCSSTAIEQRIKARIFLIIIDYVVNVCSTCFLSELAGEQKGGRLNQWQHFASVAAVTMDVVLGVLTNSNLDFHEFYVFDTRSLIIEKWINCRIWEEVFQGT